MKIALIVQRFPHGGAESYVEEIANRLYSKGEDVTVISSKSDDEKGANYPFKIIRLSKSLSIGEYSFWKDLGNVLEKEKFDLVHANTYGYYHSDKAARLKNKIGYKLVMTSHGFTGIDIHKLKKKKMIQRSSPLDFLRSVYDNNVGKKTLLQCDHLIALSKYDVDFYTEIGIDKAKVSVIPPGIKDSFFVSRKDDVQKLRDSIDADPILLSVGELSWIKNHAMVIKAMPYILKKKPRAKFVVIGHDGGELETLRHLSRKLGVEKHILFLGSKSTEEVSIYMQSADLLLQTSLAEGLSTVLLESMASGLPFITTPAGGNGYLAEQSHAGVTVPFQDEVSLGDIILTLIDDKNKMEKMSIDGLVYAKELSWDKIFLQLLHVYENFLNRNN